MASRAPTVAAATPAAAATATPSRKRFFIMVLLFITVVINYLDRSNLSIAAPTLTRELGIDPVHAGLIFSAFGWTYAAMQIPGGWLVDRVPPRVLYTVALALWSLATVFLGLAGSFIALFVLRLAVGALEAPAYPINSRVVTTWFPERERATAIGFYTSGQFVGLAFLTPVLAWLQVSFGWHMVFVVTGAVGILWAIAWYALYREPRQFPGANEAEVALIEQGGGLVDIATKAREPFRWADLGIVLSQRKLWGIYLGQFCLNSTLWFFLTWFPTYLVNYRHMDFIKSGLLASLPFLAAFVGVLCSGFFSDWLIRRGASLGLARKLPIISGLLISTCILGANYLDSTPLVIACLALAFFGNGLASITWSLVSTLAPARLLGLTGGMFNFIGNLAAIVTPTVIGFLATGDSFALPIAYIATTALLGALSYIVLVGKVERIRID
ncbi:MULTISPECIES: MFS transporter [unclassified Pseudomonas]|uniref:MFS transporter n=1 Tax=unclassified Pseudomonas TaxID=196821 RepID=UPI000BDC65C7|nr:MULTISPECIES: MFS transporter [unclassified Pseudomonas]PVZ20317.1 ACS family D-galactonate transporter-like MFS transporter [Pseudomonas sp. URIL14HWK12:I12]PVZ27383.1 ACS family D-galactonate transporter-like MFS transporter [Pseudomonas sp. URIL14HWK12:I10]PVZ38272.1 ACS family D-galactonate transporter-like MFS transporter [Pseudomonas sp. URIL14HWK12:I11]SNZ04013.1 MFS transporter, ACS family, D-galactonate transporter [Pseudomonas sp. URIL14HWK12:I9]